MFSILIPTWNNLALLKLCTQAIQQKTILPYEIIVHVNEGIDGSLEWVQQQSIKYRHSIQNIGICKAMNGLASLAAFPYLVYLNDDMVVCSNWDKALWNVIQELNTNAFLISGTLIEPRASGNACVVVHDFGVNPQTFNEIALEEAHLNLIRSNWLGATWPPSVVHRSWWDKVGGYSEEFSPGMSSDNDFSMKMWQAGCRIFLGVGDSLTYHFMSRSTGKVVRNDGRKQFLQKWHMTQSTFDRHYLRRGQEARDKVLKEPQKTFLFYWDHFRSQIKRCISLCV